MTTLSPTRPTSLRPSARTSSPPPPREGARGPIDAYEVRARPPSGGAPNDGLRTALQKHVDFFDQDGDGTISLADTYAGLRRLGLGASRAAGFAVAINAGLGKGGLSVDTASIADGIHASDTDVYDARGRFDSAAFDRLFARHAGPDGRLGAEELGRMFGRNREPGDVVGSLASRAEFGLLLELAGGPDRRIDRATLLDFYNGSLFYTIADDVARQRAAARPTLIGRLTAPLGEIL